MRQWRPLCPASPLKNVKLNSDAYFYGSESAVRELRPALILHIGNVDADTTIEPVLQVGARGVDEVAAGCKVIGIVKASIPQKHFARCGEPSKIKKAVARSD